MDALVMVCPPPMVANGVIRVACVIATTDPAIPTIGFAIDYQYGATTAAKQTAILNAAYQAYVDYCGSRSIVPIPANQIRREVTGL